jgi:Kef-type K+ transport system membrane component KefB
MLVGIILFSKIIARITKTVDIIWYIILGLIGTQYLFHFDATLLEDWSTIGVIFIMFYAGWKEQFLSFLINLWKNKWVALFGAIGPFIGGLVAFNILGFSMTQSIVAGFIFTSSAVPYTIAVFRGLGLEDSKAATTVLSSSVTDNFLSILLAVGILPAFALFQNAGGLSGDFNEILTSLGSQIGLIVLGFAIFAVLGLIILPDKHMRVTMGVPDLMQKNWLLSRIVYLVYRFRKAPGFNDVFSMFKDMRIGIPLTLLFVFGLSWGAHHLGLHPAIGAYLTGLILHHDMFNDTTVTGMEEPETAITHKNLSTFFYFLQEWVGPIFFIYLGSQLVADWSQFWYVGLLALGAAILVGLSQFWSAYFGARKSSKLEKHDATLFGIGMLPCDVIAFVILGIATTSGLIQANSIFIIVIVITILLINIAMSLLVRWYKPRYLAAKQKNQI